METGSVFWVGGGGGLMGAMLQLLANNIFSRDFHTPNIRTDVEN